jgi:hypothetical protein
VSDVTASGRIEGGGGVGWVFARTAIGGGGKRLAKLAVLLLAFAVCLAPHPQRTADAPGRETWGRTASAGVTSRRRDAYSSMGDKTARSTEAGQRAARRKGGGVGAATRVMAAVVSFDGDDAAARRDGWPRNGMAGAELFRSQARAREVGDPGTAVLRVAGAAPRGRDADDPMLAVMCVWMEERRRECRNAQVTGEFWARMRRGVSRTALDEITMVGTSFGTLDKACPPIWLLSSTTHLQPRSLRWGGQ